MTERLTRRTFLGQAGLAALAPYASAQDDKGQRANVVLIMADDLGYGDLGCYGCPDINTPSIDKLAAQGVRMTDYYASAPVCTPTRCALMTGRYQQRCANLEWALYGGIKTAGLAPEESTIADMLKRAGYETAMYGKWHLGARPEWAPNQHGFDNYFGLLSGNIDYFRHIEGTGEKDLFKNETPVEREGYITDLITEHSVEYIKSRTDKPFFLYVAYNAPHWPMQGPDDQDKEIVPGKNWAEKDRETYVEMVESMDSGIGRILDALEQRGLADETLVIFCSDNGGDKSSLNTPLRGGKGTLWEGGIRVPCIMRWPGILPAGSVNPQAAITMDVSATILSAALAKPTRKLDGMDLLPYLTGYRNPVEQTMVWRSQWKNEYAVRWGKWKWLKRGDDEYLFQLKKDIGEQENLIERFPDIAVWLRDIYSQWEDAMPYEQSIFGEDMRQMSDPRQGIEKRG